MGILWVWCAFGRVFGLGFVDVEAVLLHEVLDHGGGFVDDVCWHANVEVVEVGLCECRGGGIGLWALEVASVDVVLDL